MDLMNHKESRLHGVGCDVITCKYHAKDNSCCADCISVKNENAAQKSETFCGTFTPRACK